MKVTVIGIGHIGLPLALTIDAETPHQVQAFDVSDIALKQLTIREASFAENGMQELLATHQVTVTNQIQKSEAYIVTVGTPVTNHFTPDTSAVDDVIWHLFDNDLMKDSLLVLRSTVPIGYTEGVVERIAMEFGMTLETDYYMAYCPERIAEGVAIEELKSHPQLIGTEQLYNSSYFVATLLFSWIKPIAMTFKNAEFAKLATNTYRTMHFAIASYLQMAGMKHGVDFIGVRDQMMEDYPRLTHLPRPGFTGGPCLRKDFAMLGRPGDLAFQSYMVNEEYPRWVVENSVGRDLRVLILGAGFKDSSDDVRDSLVETLYNEAKRVSNIEPVVYDPALDSWHYYKLSGGQKIAIVDRECAEELDFDVIIFGNPLTKYNPLLYKILSKDALLVDPFGYYMSYQVHNVPF